MLKYGSKVMLLGSLVPPLSRGKRSGDHERFPGCAKSAVLILNNPVKYLNVIQALRLANEIALRHKDIIIRLFKDQDC